jgi:capping protein beta
MVDGADDEKKFNAVCNLMRRLPPNQFDKCLAGFFEFIEDEDLQGRIVESIDMPLEITNADDGRPFLKHEFNRDGDSYRSPHDNKYYPANPEGVELPANLR